MATPASDHAKLKQAVNACKAHGDNQSEAARTLGISRTTLQSRLREAKTRNITADDDPVYDVADLTDRERIALEDKIRDLQAEIKAIHRSELSEEKVREQVFGLAAVKPNPPSWLINATRGAGVSGVPSVLWSDWHWGEVVRPEQVNHVNEYNLSVAHARLRKLVERTIDLCFNHMTSPKYPGIVVNLGGDMISGEIHEELTETNEAPSMPLLLDLFDKTAWALTQLADRFGRVFVAGAVGNHGRTTHKPRMKNRVYSNYDWLLYSLLERHFKANKDDRMQFLVPAGTDVNYTVYGHRYLLTHGDALGVKGGDGIIGALGPILRGTFKTANAANAMGEPFDTILMGHWHQYIALRGLIVNGSLKGFDEFAKAMRFRPDTPEQALWFTHPEHGITCSWPIRLVEKKRGAQQQDWVSWPKVSA
jgi:transposase-like protein